LTSKLALRLETDLLAPVPLNLLFCLSTIEESSTVPLCDLVSPNRFIEMGCSSRTNQSRIWWNDDLAIVSLRREVQRLFDISDRKDGGTDSESFGDAGLEKWEMSRKMVDAERGRGRFGREGLIDLATDVV
jgi:hypothetical protein